MPAQPAACRTARAGGSGRAADKGATVTIRRDARRCVKRQPGSDLGIGVGPPTALEAVPDENDHIDEDGRIYD